MTHKFRRVLVVDDCEMFRHRLTRALTTQGYMVTTANDGLQAYEYLKRDSFDYVITDWDMPGLDGALLCKRIRSEIASDQYVYIIMTTGCGERADVVASFAAGVDDFMLKPVNTSELIARMAAGARVLQRDRELSFQAQRDPLTRLFNRRSMMPRLDATVDHYRRMGKPISCILLDIDHFKQINDQYGHSAGDGALISVAHSLSSSFRSTDDVFRYGGEEFLVVLPTADLSNAERRAQRCREAIMQLNLESYGVPIGITASFGVAEMTPSHQSTKDLVERADRALLMAKQSGRNCVVVDSPLSQAGV